MAAAIHPFKIWMIETKTTGPAIARYVRKLGLRCSDRYPYAVAARKRRPSWELSEAFSAMTQGRVSVKDFRLYGPAPGQPVTKEAA